MLFDGMDTKDFAAWRQRVGLTQEEAAAKLGVTRTTIQNWESGATSIPNTVEAGCQIWEQRLKQENPEVGPVTLIYSDGPMFVNPYGPRQRLAMMHQEPYATNAAAISRIQQLWGREDFYNPFVIESSGKPLWNIVELGRVVDGSDSGAPTLVNMLHALARFVKANSDKYVRSGPRMHSPSEVEQRQRQFAALAAELDKLATTVLHDPVTRSKIDEVLSNIRKLGIHPKDSLVSGIAQAFAART